jgi:CBS domain containing-hemolysin-like protein
MWLALQLVTAAVLILLNAFFVLAEFAIVKVRDTRMQELARGGNAGAELAHHILGKLDAYLSACQLGITMASLGLGWVGEPATARLLEDPLRRMGVTDARLLHSIAFAVGFSVITTLHIVIGEQAPKMLAIKKAEGAALFIARPLHWFYRVCYAPLWVLNQLSNGVLRILGIKFSEHERAHSEEELRMIIGASHEHGQFTLSRLLMMENVLDFGTLTVADVMVPWEKVTLLDPKAPWPQNFEIIRKKLHSRYPLAKSPRPDSQVHIKDLLIAMTGGATPDLVKIARPVQSVKADLSLEALLVRFHKTASHLAFVEDGTGALAGLVTLEDVIEELIGTVRDEFEQVTDYSLATIVPSEAIVLDLPPDGKEASVRGLAEKLVQHTPCPLGDVVAGVMKREALASTGLGEGIAIPHCRAPGLPRPMAALGRSPEGIEWKAVDGKPVDLVFLILTPPHDEGAHVHILEKIATLLSSDYLRERLRQAKTVDEVVEVFRISDKALVA